jgi:hypothetical protein
MSQQRQVTYILEILFEILLHVSSIDLVATRGVYVNSPHILTRIDIPKKTNNLYPVVVTVCQVNFTLNVHLRRLLFIMLMDLSDIITSDDEGKCAIRLTSQENCFNIYQVDL